MRPIERTIRRVASALLCAALLWPAQPALALFIQDAPKLVGTGAGGSAQQGYSVALSANGHTAIVGGPFDNNNAGGGAAWVFTRSGGVWFQQGNKLVGSGAVGSAEQGWSVALSADGNTAIVGGPDDNNRVGAAWVFTRSGGVWSQQTKLFGPSAIGAAQQGHSVALSADGNTALLGGPNDNNGVGAAWVFTRSGGVWFQQGQLVGSGAVGNSTQGYSVALSADGNTAIVGGPNDNNFAGAAWVFTRSGGVWFQQGNKLVGSGAVGTAQEGFSVALSADGNTAIVGGPNDNSSAGAAWVFTRTGEVWTPQGSKLVGTGAVGAASQGFSVALSGGGNTVIVGGPNDNNTINIVGAAWVFTRSGGVWSQQGSKLVGTGAVGNSTQGRSVALSCNTAIVGGPGDNNFAGAAWVFVAPPTATHDFNGDCLSDIVWYNTTSGQVVTWFVDGTSVIGGGSPGSAPSPWAIVGQRDFNGDGRSDILWRNGTTGQVVLWFLNGTTIIGGGSPGSVTTDWAVAGTGDFNGDGYADILWFNKNSGQALIWLMNGTSVIGGGSPGPAPGWTVAGTGDFNGDGMTDILWYNTTSGQVVLWFLNGTSVIGGGSPGGAASPWVVAGTGDFNEDGMSDILWYNTSTGQAVIWLLNGTSVITGGSPGTAASPWTIASTGAFNRDPISDILWYNTSTGQVVVWLVVYGFFVNGGGSPGSAASPWLLQGMNAD
jgi:hypothetical protein